MNLGKSFGTALERIGRAPALGCAILCASLFVPMGSGVSAETDKSAAAGAAGDVVEGWVYLGRRSERGWRPASISVASPRYPVKPGDRLRIKRDALVYGSVDCKVIPAADFKAEGVPEPALRVKAGAGALDVVGAPIECPSVGQAKTVWANVKIPAERLVSAQR
jgi:hypothetical protein